MRNLTDATLAAVVGCGRDEPAPAAAVAVDPPTPEAPAPETVPAPPGYRVLDPGQTSGGRGYGTFPVVDADSNSSTRLVAEAAADGRHPERLSPMALPAPFDAAAYARDPYEYCQVSEPGRVWQTAQPGPRVPVLRRAIRGSPAIRQGDSAVLAVITAPGAPVSFTVTDGGLFANGLTAITVPANDDGEAVVAFTAIPGSIGVTSVIAGSPAASGTITFRVQVLPAATAAASSTATAPIRSE